MSPHETVGLGGQFSIAVVKTLILLVGGLVTYFAFKAHRRTRDRSLGLLAAGFGLITLGVLVAGFTHQLLDQPLGVGVLVESLLVLVGMSIIAYSLYER